MLSTPVPSTDAMVTALGAAAMADITIYGAKDIAAAITGETTEVDINLTITGASTVTVMVTDPTRQLLRSPELKAAAVLTLPIGPGNAPLSFVLVEVTKQADQITLNFEAMAVHRLRQVSGILAQAAGAGTRSSFAARLVAQTPGPPIVIHTWPGAPPTLETLARGTTQAPAEDTWTALTRLAAEVQWRCFEVAGEIWFGPDSWLLAEPSLGTVREFDGGVDFIDYDWDTGKPLVSGTITAVAGLWAFRPGKVITLAGCGPADGPVIISGYSRPVEQEQCNVTITAPQPALPEPSETTVAAVTSGSSTVVNAAQSPGGSATAQAALAAAKAQLGVPYQWGGENPGTDFDCSGLVAYAYGHAGVSIPRVAQAQYDAGPQVNGGLRPGDLVFFGTGPGGVSHVGMYVGNGQMIDAPHAGSVVRYDTIPTTIGAHWGADVVVGFTRPAP